jgi:hypothetical protein
MCRHVQNNLVHNLSIETKQIQPCCTNLTMICEKFSANLHKIMCSIFARKKTCELAEAVVIVTTTV